MNKIAIRSQVCAPPGFTLIQADLSAAEAWVVAFLAKDDNMKMGLEKNIFHELTGSVIFDTLIELVTKDQRYLGKRNNHANNYGQGAEQLARTINKDSDKPPFVTVTVAEARVLWNKWHGFYRIRDWWDSIQEDLRRNGRTLTTPYGRERQFFGFWGDGLFKEAYAFIPQSTIADHMLGADQPEVMVKGGLLEFYESTIHGNERELRIINTSHDSAIVLSPTPLVDEISGILANTLYRPMIINGERVDVPVEVEIGERWGELEKKKVSLIRKEIC